MFRLLIIWFCKNSIKKTRKGLFFCEGLARSGTRKVRDSLRDSQGLADFFSHKISQKFSKIQKKSSKNVLPGVEMGQIDWYDYVFSDYLIIFYKV